MGARPVAGGDQIRERLGDAEDDGGDRPAADSGPVPPYDRELGRLRTPADGSSPPSGAQKATRPSRGSAAGRKTAAQVCRLC